MRRTATLVLLVSIAACSRGTHVASVAIEQKCTQALLKGSAPYGRSMAGLLEGEFTVVHRDTVTRPAYRWPAGMSNDTTPPHWWVVRLHRPGDAGQTYTSPRGRAMTRPMIIGTIVGMDTAGFEGGFHASVDYGDRPYLHIVYDKRHGKMLDGPSTSEDVPVQVVGPWGFGGYWEDHPYLLASDLDGKIEAPFAGFYCAFRKTQ